MMNEKCAACIHCEVCGFIESEVAKGGACDFYEDGKRWRPIKTRPITEKEKEYFVTDAEFIYECDLPDDGQTVLITDKRENVETDTFYRDDGCYKFAAKNPQACLWDESRFLLDKYID